MAQEISYEVPSWNQIYDMLLNLSQKISKSKFKPHIIVGISRGGWIPARILSDLLENQNLANIKAERYSGIGKVRGRPLLTQPLSMDVSGKRVLVVDEVVDSGESLKLIISHMFNKGPVENKTATLYCKPKSALKPDYYVKETTCWVIFPWEIKETVRSILNSYGTEHDKVESELERIVEAGVSKQLISRFVREFSELKKC